MRRQTPAGEVSTLAGLAGSPGSADGAGSSARFNTPVGLAVDSADNIYVADAGNNTIRKVTADGVVSTVAGLAGNAGTANGTSAQARFNTPCGVAVDEAGDVYVADTYNHTIRQTTPLGTVSTLAGQTGLAGSADGLGDNARFYAPFGVAVDNAGNVYVADSGNDTVRVGQSSLLRLPRSISADAQNQVVTRLISQRFPDQRPLEIRAAALTSQSSALGAVRGSGAGTLTGA
ncbi:MAG: NHL repeat-containing protein [Limisphaerales bacterium]